MKEIEQKEQSMHIPLSREWTTIDLARVDALLRTEAAPAIGYLVWTKQNHGEREVEETIQALRARQIIHLRTGISWAEWVEPEGREWIRWYIRRYAAHVTVLPCLTFTPPAYGIEPRVNAPPRDTSAYARFVNEVLTEFGEFFDAVELWNEWNLNTDWDPSLDPTYLIFATMVGEAAHVVRRFGKRVVLGGPSKVNDETLGILADLRDRGLTEHVDVLGFHNLRGTWSDHVPPPPLTIQAELLRVTWGRQAPIWLTEYGFPVADPEHRFDLSELEMIQVSLFAHMTYACLTGALERAYWYTYKDEVHVSLRAATTGWEDILQFYFGDTDEAGTPRLLGRLLSEGGPAHVLRFAAHENLFPFIDRASLGRNLVE